MNVAAALLFPIVRAVAASAPKAVDLTGPGQSCTTDDDCVGLQVQVPR